MMRVSLLMLSEETLMVWNRRQKNTPGYAAVQYSQGRYSNSLLHMSSHVKVLPCSRVIITR